MSAFTTCLPKARAPAATRPRMVAVQAKRQNNRLATSMLAGVAAATLMAGSADAAKLGLFPELQGSSNKGAEAGVTADPGTSKNAPGAAKTAKKDAVDKAVDKFSTEGKADPNPRFQGKSGVDNKVTPKDGDFKNVKPDERK